MTWKCATDTDISNASTDCSPQWNGVGEREVRTSDGVLITDDQTGEVIWDITLDVLDDAEFGWLIQKRDEELEGFIQFNSKESAFATSTPEFAPRLVLEYGEQYLLFSEKDSNLREGFPNLNQGANANVNIDNKLGETTFVRFVVDFDVAATSTYANLKKAHLVLTVNETPWPPAFWGSNRYLEVYRLLSDWEEGDSEAFLIEGNQFTVGGDRGTGSGVTWNCVIDSDISNDDVDCGSQWSGASSGSGSVAPRTADGVPIGSGQTGRFIWDVTQDVKDGADFGWLIRKANQNAGGFVKFHSKEGAEALGDPYLGPLLLLEF